jgi:hypothetical protein
LLRPPPDALITERSTAFRSAQAGLFVPFLPPLGGPIFFVKTFAVFWEKNFLRHGSFRRKIFNFAEKNGAGTKYKNKDKENNSTHNVLCYV